MILVGVTIIETLSSFSSEGMTSATSVLTPSFSHLTVNAIEKKAQNDRR